VAVRATGPRFELVEIGASAGINTMMDRYAYDLGGTMAGPPDSLMRIVPEWRGEAPPANPVEIVGLRGCDIAPVDLTDPAAAQRLKAYIWADATERMARMDAAIALATAKNLTWCRWMPPNSSVSGWRPGTRRVLPAYCSTP
jgi:hypothetical protein